MRKRKAKSEKRTDIEELVYRLQEISHVSSAAAVLSWDQEVNLPRKAVSHRAQTIAKLSGLLHQELLSINHDGLLSSLKKKLDTGKIMADEAVIISETWRSYSRTKKLPEAFVREMSQVTSEAQAAWAHARAQSDFTLFKPWLEKIVELKRREAEYVGYKNSPYDALLDTYEPNMKSEDAAVILNNLKNFLVPFLAKIRKSSVKIDPKKVFGEFPIQKQYEFNKFISEKIGYDTEAGRIDISTHPFTTTFHTHDVRFTTRYDKKNVLYALGSTIHEAGHALYEQGLEAEHFGTPLGEAISLGIHESQSRMWENMIGKSFEFWRYFYPKLQKEFPKPFNHIPLQEFYSTLNQVQFSYIRTESDEVSYNLHIILRFEIEKQLIEGTLKIKDAPKLWKQKMQEYLGVNISDDAQGILQDVHWSAGLIGYFPTYSFGNLYAAQFYNQMQKDLPDLKRLISQGKFWVIKEWLRVKIHTHGKRFTAEALVKDVTGEPLNSKYFSDYLQNKYSKLYSIK